MKNCLLKMTFCKLEQKFFHVSISLFAVAPELFFMARIS
jgi:hypothetical protein